MKFGIPQVIMVAIMFGGQIIALQRHGKIRTVKDNYLWDFIGLCIGVFLLWWGGFWTG